MGYMRKCFFLSIAMASFFADVCAFGATARGSRSIANAGATAETTKSADTSATSGNQTVSARVANRTRVRTVPEAQPGQAVSARVAVRNTSKNVAKSVGNMNAAAGKNLRVGMGNPIMQTTSARAATKQKAVNMGTKITTATENTSISEECQDAFYGCMDALCMLANTSGGRCRCDDRSEELDDVLDQIMKLDSQSKTLAEEGVERLQRGDAVDAIYSMAEDAANKVVAGQKKNQKDFLNTESKSSSSSKKLDMSMFNSGVFDTDDLFGELDDDILGADLSDKKGNALRSAATKMCVAELPSQCKEHSSMLQLVYAQKIKSDCIAYENDLKQQKMNSENLLKTAQKAVRDAAAEAYESKNKYKTVGECVVAFKQCMLGEDACGSGFSKCVIDPTLMSSTSSKAYTIKTSKSITVEISASTYSTLEGNRSFCDGVLKQCVDANKNDAVWKQFLVNVAPELKAAEYSAEDDSRRNCARNVVSCIKEQAVTEGLQEGTDNWYIFTSNTANVQNFCKIPLQQCNAYGTNNEMEKAVMSFVKLSLDALRADRCTASIKNCLQREDNCHKDYTGCIGVGMNTMWSMCEEIVTPNCTGKEDEILKDPQIKQLATDNNMELSRADALKLYVWKVAKGLILSIDSELANACRKAVSNALIAACGSETECTNEDAYASNDLIDKCVSYQMCPTKEGSKETCQEVTNMELIASEKFSEGWQLKIEDKCNIGISNGQFTGDAIAINELNEKYQVLMNKINNAENIQNCIYGRKLEGLGSSVSIRKGYSEGFEQLTNNAQAVVLQGLYTNVKNQMNARLEEVKATAKEDAANLKKYMEEGKEKAITEAKEVCDTNPCSCYGKDSKYASILSAGDLVKYMKACGEGYKTLCEADPCGCENLGEDLLGKADKTKFANACKSKQEEQKIEDEASTVCDYGKCNGCKTALKKCQCIALTYFQHGPVRFAGSGDGEYVWLHKDSIQVKDGYCLFDYNRVYNCGDYDNDPDFAGCEYNDGDADKMVTVRFPLTDSTPISISKCEASDAPWNNGRDYKDVLTIGDTKITFNHCSYGHNFTWKGGIGETMDGQELRKDRGKNACFFCSLQALFKNPTSNSPTITETTGRKEKGGSMNLFLEFKDLE